MTSLDPACRLVCLALLSSASLLAGWPLAAGLAAAFAGLLVLGGLRLSRLLTESSVIALFAVGTALVRLVGGTGGAEGLESALGFFLAYGAKLLAAFLAGRLFYASTKPSEARDAITRMARGLPFLKRYDLGLSVSLVVNYLPMIFDEWREARCAARARGMPRRPSVAQSSRFIEAFLRRLILKAVDLPQALVARGWSKDRGLAPMNWKVTDSAVLAASGLIFVGALLRYV